MTGMPWFKCYPRDFNDGMVGLTLEERGAYITILNVIYARGCPVEDDAGYFRALLCCSGKTWTKIRASLIVKRKLFVVNYNGVDSLMNRRAADEIAQSEEKSKKFSEAGRRGGQNSRPVSNENSDLGEARLKAGLSDTDTEAEQTNPPTPQEGEAENGAGPRRKPRRAIPVGFPDAEAIAAAQAKARGAGVSLDAAAQAERFRNHALSVDRRCSDWGAAWRNWFGKAMAEAPRLPGVGTVTAIDPWPRRVREFRRNGYWHPDWGPKPGKPGCQVPANVLEETAA